MAREFYYAHIREERTDIDINLIFEEQTLIAFVRLRAVVLFPSDYAPKMTVKLCKLDK